MERRQLGMTDMQVSVLGFGGSEIGYEGVPAATVKKMLHNALDLGLNAIDTAECYVDSEELVGRALGARRKECYIFTKCGHPRGGDEDWRPSSILETVERSLKRLRTDYVDLIQLHSCSEAVLRKGDAIDALKRARDRGYARYIGYSGDGRAALYAIQCGAFHTLQTSLNIAEQEAVELTLPLAREKAIGVIAKRPLANVAWKSGRQSPRNFYAYTYWERLQKLRYEFLQGELEDTVGIALRFTLSVPGVHTAIVGTAKPERIQKNAAIAAAPLLPQDLFSEIRARWRDVAEASWVGQT